MLKPAFQLTRYLEPARVTNAMSLAHQNSTTRPVKPGQQRLPARHEVAPEEGRSKAWRSEALQKQRQGNGGGKKPRNRAKHKQTNHTKTHQANEKDRGNNPKVVLLLFKSKVDDLFLLYVFFAFFYSHVCCPEHSNLWSQAEKMERRGGQGLLFLVWHLQ